MDDLLPIIIGVIALTIFSGSKMTSKKVKKVKKVKKLNKGLRNNNWLNIKYSPANNWVGQVGTDGTFAKFSNPIYSLRAGFKILNTYSSKYGLTTIRDIISRFAPPGGEDNNDTENYIRFVSEKTGLSPTEPIPIYMRPKLIAAMVQMEIGMSPNMNEVFRAKDMSEQSA